MERLIKILTLSDKRAQLLISGDLGMAWSLTAKFYNIWYSAFGLMDAYITKKKSK